MQGVSFYNWSVLLQIWKENSREDVYFFFVGEVVAFKGAIENSGKHEFKPRYEFWIPRQKHGYKLNVKAHADNPE